MANVQSSLLAPIVLGIPIISHFSPGYDNAVRTFCGITAGVGMGQGSLPLSLCFLSLLPQTHSSGDLEETSALNSSQLHPYSQG